MAKSLSLTYKNGVEKVILLVKTLVLEGFLLPHEKIASLLEQPSPSLVLSLLLATPIQAKLTTDLPKSLSVFICNVHLEECSEDLKFFEQIRRLTHQIIHSLVHSRVSLFMALNLTRCKGKEQRTCIE